MSQITNIKKGLTVDLFKIITRALEHNKSFLRIEKDNTYKIIVFDKDPNSDFFYGVSKEEFLQGSHLVDAVAKPWSNSQNIIGNNRFKIGDFENHFKEWINNVKTFNENTILDDMILKGYQEEFYDDFKIAEEDADEKAFDYAKQLKLLDYLAKLENEIEQFKDESNSIAIEDIKQDISSLTEDLNKETKNSTMSRISLIWAKARKTSFKASEFMFKEFAKEFLKEGAKVVFNFALKNAHKIPEYIEYFMMKSLLPPQ